MHKYAAVFSYRGTRFCGWQEQRGSAANGNPSIQLTIQEAVQQMTGEDVSVVGSGRTDAGVHALGQVAHFVLTRRDWDPGTLQRGLNSILKQRIQAREVRRVSLDFHAQRSAEKKQYSYYFQQGPCAIPHVEPYSWWIKRTLDREAMREALSHLIGEHDFKAFQARGSKPLRTTVRTILEAEISYEPLFFPGMVERGRERYNELGFVRVRILGTGFLKQMVRGIAGTLLEVGERRRPASCMKEILESQDRSLVGPTAPARALWLERVWYPEALWPPEIRPK